MPVTQGEGPAFVLDEDKLAELFAEKAEEYGEPVSLAQFSGESVSAELASLVYDAEATGAIVRPVAGGAEIEIAVYPEDDEYGLGLFLSVRPRGDVPWWEIGMQLATTYEDLDDYLGRDGDGMFDLGEQAMRAALGYLLIRANHLLGFLAALAEARATPAA